MLAFGVPALLMILSIGMWLALLVAFCLKTISLKNHAKYLPNRIQFSMLSKNIKHARGPEKMHECKHNCIQHFFYTSKVHHFIENIGKLSLEVGW